MYINKVATKVVAQGTRLNEVFLSKRLINTNEYINVLLTDGYVLTYRYNDFFDPSTLNWIRATKVTIKYAENVIDIEEVFSYLYSQRENFSNDEGC